jgi:hypothetical protein
VLGAAFLAGIAAGTWTREDVREMWSEDRRFEPSMSGDQPLGMVGRTSLIRRFGSHSLTAPASHTAPDSVPATTTGDRAASRRTAWRPTFSRGQVAFLIAVPLVWAVVLIFHPAPDADDIYGSLRDEANRMVIVHLLSLPFLGLMGSALYLLLRDMPGRAAQIGRLAILPFVVCYVAGDAITGLATGVLVEHANDLPAGRARRSGGREPGAMGQLHHR